MYSYVRLFWNSYQEWKCYTVLDKKNLKNGSVHVFTLDVVISLQFFFSRIFIRQIRWKKGQSQQPILQFLFIQFIFQGHKISRLHACLTGRTSVGVAESKRWNGHTRSKRRRRHSTGVWLCVVREEHLLYFLSFIHLIWSTCYHDVSTDHSANLKSFTCWFSGNLRTFLMRRLCIK